MQDARTEAEEELLSIAEITVGLDSHGRHQQLEPTINDVLREAMREGYRLEYHALDGAHLHTPSGVWIWFCPVPDCAGGIEALIIDALDQPT